MAFYRCSAPSQGGGGGNYEVRYLQNISSNTGATRTVNFNLANYLDDYASLDVDNIVCELTSTWAKSSSAAFSMTLAYSYTPSTGLFTVTSNTAFGNAKVHVANFIIIKPGVSSIPTTTGITEGR